jgi:hypothetical protein
LPFDFELDGHDRPSLSSVNLIPFFSIVTGSQNPGILENRDISICRLLGLGIEPQARRDLSGGELHGLLLSYAL